MLRTPQSELTARAQKFQRMLAENDLDGALILQNADRFYFAGTVQQAHLYLPRAGAPLLMARRSFERARRESALARVIPLASPRDVPRLLREQGYAPPQRLGLELDVLPTSLYLNYREIFADAELVDASPLIRRVRAVKSEYELAALRRAARIGERTMRAMRDLLVEGISEIALAGQLEARARASGHQGLVKFRAWNNEMFYGHLMAGKTAAQPSYLLSPTGGAGVSPAFPQSASFRAIRRGEPVLFDYVFTWAGYSVDQTRVFALGKLSDDLRRAHAAMVEIQDALARAAKPGVRGGELYELAARMAQARGYAENFGGLGNDRVAFVGHGVGLELDELPILAAGQTQRLESGMVIAIEPKVSFANVGTVGIENTYVVTARGARRITRGADDITIIKPRRSSGGKR